MKSSRKRGVARVISEFAVIVIGVLAALSVESAWQHRTDRDREEEYLGQVESDSQDNIARLSEAMELEQRHLKVARKVLAAYRSAPAPPVDSVKAWLAQRDGSWWVSDPRLSEGTITALVETGDLTLLRDPVVRSAVLAYQGQIRADMEEFRRFLQYGLDGGRDLLLRGEIKLNPDIAPGESHNLRRMLAVYGDPEGIVALETLAAGYDERIWYLDQMLTATERLLRALR